jgi:MFS family permease
MSQVRNSDEPAFEPTGRSAESGDAQAIEAPRIPMRAWVAVGVLFSFLFISSIDRNLPVVLMSPLKARFGLSDLQAGILIGPAFGIFYAAMSFPMGWLADRFGYRAIIAVALAVWSVASALSAFAGSFAELVIARSVVATAEAGLSPAAYAIIAALFPKSRSALGFSFYAAAAPLGFSSAIYLGSWFGAAGLPLTEIPIFGSLYRWQACFLLTGAIGLCMLPLLLLISDVHKTESREVETLQADLMRFLTTHARRIGALLVLFVLMATLALPIALWGPAHAHRTFGESITVPLALVASITGTFGGLVLGRVAVELRKSVRDPYVLLATVSTAIILPISLIGFQSRSEIVFLIGFGAAFGLFVPFFGYAIAAFIEFTPPALRARVGAIFLTAINLFANVIGPPMIGRLSEALGPGEGGLGKAIVYVLAAGTVLIVSTGLTILFLGRSRPRPAGGG